MSCLFCSILERKIDAAVVYEDEFTLAFRDIRPVAPTHILIIPKKHVSAVHELEASDATAIGHVLVAARRIADEHNLTQAGYRLVVNDGADAGQTVHHLHVHLLGGRAMSWPPG